MAALMRLGGARAESRWVDGAAGRVHYLEAGHGDPPLVLLHGAGGGAANWYRLLGALAETRRVLAPDLPGFGLSDPVRPRAPLGVQAAELTLDWIERVNLPKLDVLGTSFGGLVALRLALLRPVGVRRVVLLNACGLGKGVAMPVRVAALPGIRDGIRRPGRTGTNILFRTLLTSSRVSLPAEHQAAIIDYTWRAACSTAGTVIAEALGLFTGLAGQRDILRDEELARVRQPVLVIWGARDRFLPPRHAQRARRMLPHASIHLLPNVGHSPNWEAPEAVLERMLPFLEREEAPAP